MISRLSAVPLAAAAALACAEPARPSPDAAAPVTVETGAPPAPSVSSSGAGDAAAVAQGSGAQPPLCPPQMVAIAGGRFRAGTDSPNAAPEERPAFETEVATFCLDETEVTVRAYAACVTAGTCQPADGKGRFCNVRLPERDDHPINCVDWHQARAYCASRGARLPTEIEWEYAARGGTEYRAYSWGTGSPDGRACWKHVGGTCRVREFAPGAFGLYDMIGNVWEWTDDWFGDYPWPPPTGSNKVYRGGSWSRRFEKWMSPRLRNRWPPRQQGSHLGMRCALTPKATSCPYGRSADGSRCQYGVAGATCEGKESWNGLRCARPGAAGCPDGRDPQPGHGCVLTLDVRGPAPESSSTPVTRARTPEFDADCAQNKPGRPHAYRYSGGTHHARNLQSGGAGCANRDVGVGWNSTCCP